jgi:hypothetical protein
MKFNSYVSKFLTNKWVSNIVVFLAIFNIIGYIIKGKLNAALCFVLFSVLLSYFSKNMIIVLGVPLVIINLLFLTRNVMEGMENKDSSIDTSTDNKVTNDIDKKKKEHDVEVNNLDEPTENNKKDIEIGRRKNRGHNIDYAKTVEDAYDELNNILGSEGIQQLTTDTQNLIKQQAELAKSMEGMSKLFQNIQPMVDQLQDVMNSSKDGTA